MKPYYQDNDTVLYNGDCRNMVELPDESVQCVVTSPPYWGLRKYAGLEDLIWDSRDGCQHEWTGRGLVSDRRAPDVIQGKSRTTTRHYGDDPTKTWSEDHQKHYQDNFCSLCGAWRGSFGLEPTVELYVQHTVEILQEIRRVLRRDGTCFLNLGDSYQDKQLQLIPQKVALAAQEGWRLISEETDRGWLAGIIDGEGCIGIRLFQRKDKRYPEVQPFIQVGVNDLPIIEKCQRITRLGRRKDRKREGRQTLWTWYVEGEAVEQVLGEIYDYLTIKQPQVRIVAELLRSKATRGSKHHPQNDELIATRYKLWREIKACNQRRNIEVNYSPPARINERWYVRSVIIWKKSNPMPESMKDRPSTSHEYILMLTKSARYYWDAEAVREANSITGVPWGASYGTKANVDTLTGGKRNSGLGPRTYEDRLKWQGKGRNIRSVWEFPTQPYPDAHFAVFPEKLPEMCIKAATPDVGCCSDCGAPWQRMTEVAKNYNAVRADTGKARQVVQDNIGGKINGDTGGGHYYKERYDTEVKTTGWQPTCSCNADKVPSLVLDPFAGSGTTLWVAKRMGRRSVGYELSSEYCDLAIKRLHQQSLL